jgi:predicted porin
MKVPRMFVCALVCIAIAAGNCFADDSRDDVKAQLEALKQQAAALTKQIQDLQQKIDQEKSQQPKTEQQPAPGTSQAPSPQTTQTRTSQSPAEHAVPRPPADAFAPNAGKTPHGFFERKPGDKLTFYVPGGEFTAYGNMDLSFDVITKGLGGEIGPDGNPPVGNMGWIPDVSTNISYIGVRGFQNVNGLPFNFIYQIETQMDIAAQSGTSETNSNESNVVKGALSSRNSYIGLQNDRWGSLMIGKTDAPYKNSTAKFDPFFGMIGDYQVIMGNTGGDNRVEFATRLDHSIWWQSPNWNGVLVDALVSPGQNRASDNDNIAAGESDCTGGNIPGSGGITPLTCSDGSFGTAYSGSISYTKNHFYMTAAYERHQKVNRQSDITGLYASGNAYSQMLEAQDVADEDAGKVGALYTFPSKTTFGAIFETLHRYVAEDLQFQNERQRLGTWAFLSQQLTKTSSVHFGWAHAFRTPGDPGQHNDSLVPAPGGDPTTDFTAGAHANNQANLFTAAFKNQLSNHLTAYLTWALTANGPAAHYDLGAGGRSVTTDCHDASDATGGLVGSDPHCWTGGQLRGVSAGLDYKF